MDFFFFKSTFSLKSFRHTIRVSNSLDPDQASGFVGLSWVQTVCKRYQQMTKVATSGERVKLYSSMYLLLHADKLSSFYFFEY